MLQRDVARGIHAVADGYVNWYLVEDDSGVLVVDAGLPPHWKDLKGRDLFPLPVPEIAVDEGVFVPTQGSFLAWQLGVDLA